MDHNTQNSWFSASPGVATTQAAVIAGTVPTSQPQVEGEKVNFQDQDLNNQQPDNINSTTQGVIAGVNIENGQQILHQSSPTGLPPNVQPGANGGQILLKLLVPAYAAGSVIGKNGQTITHLQKETGVNIKLSKAKDFYPGTTERIALIQGKYEGVLLVLKFIIDKVYEFPIPKDMVMQNAERAKQVKTIVPNTTAGLIIGKKGATIKTIMETSKAKVQLTQKPDSPNMQQLLERVITVCGERDQLYAASTMILTRIRDDPQSASCPNLSYQNVTGLVANANPTGSPYAPVNEATLLTAANGLGLSVNHHPVNTLSTIGALHQPIMHNHQLANLHNHVGLNAGLQHGVGSLGNAGHGMGPQHTPPPGGQQGQQPGQQQQQQQQGVQTAAQVVANSNQLTNQQIAGLLANQNQHIQQIPQNQNGYEVYSHYQVTTNNPNLMNQQPQGQFKTMM